MTRSALRASVLVRVVRAAPIAPVALGLAVFGGGTTMGCGSKSLVGQTCTEPGKTQCDVNDNADRLVRCDGNFFVTLAECANQCVDKKPVVNHPGGPLTADETWECAAGPHVVTTPITVGAGVTLTIEQGALLKLQPASHIDTDPAGRIVAVGIEGAEILVTSANAARGGYGDDGDGGLNVFAVEAGGGEPSDIEHVILERGIQGLGVFGLSATTTAPTVKDNTLRDNLNFGILVSGCGDAPVIPDFKADGNQFFGNGGEVSDCNTQTP